MGSQPSQPSLPEVDLDGKVVVVTGANTGIGYETAKTLAQVGSKVILACRSESKANQVDDLHVEFMTLDLASLESTMTFIEAYKSKGLPLHVLVCNAGIFCGPKALTSDGYKPHFQIHYLSHFLLVLHLLPVLKSSGPGSRVVSVASGMYRLASWNVDDMQCLENPDLKKRYATSKWYQV
ncbi:WW domain-containing oxidoreductase-like [Strongylocentrotus purpuratus]|uniref:Uncharacterized protein n=1 Tax=Strongylocentrotus purpuratus TaxID=7668 RepID=A0A7M7PFD9_STRPU|nr:WW domain-containing oxidoreductase-like [Strongylocentrotus purpuratus]